MTANQILKKVKLLHHRERTLYVALLEKHKWNREKARKSIKMSRATFFRVLEELELTNLTPKEWRKL